MTLFDFCFLDNKGKLFCCFVKNKSKVYSFMKFTNIRIRYAFIRNIYFTFTHKKIVQTMTTSII